MYIASLRQSNESSLLNTLYQRYSNINDKLYRFEIDGFLQTENNYALLATYYKSQ